MICIAQRPTFLEKLWQLEHFDRRVHNLVLFTCIMFWWLFCRFFLATGHFWTLVVLSVVLKGTGKWMGNDGENEWEPYNGYMATTKNASTMCDREVSLFCIFVYWILQTHCDPERAQQILHRFLHGKRVFWSIGMPKFFDATTKFTKNPSTTHPFSYRPPCSARGPHFDGWQLATAGSHWSWAVMVPFFLFWVGPGQMHIRQKWCIPKR